MAWPRSSGFREGAGEVEWPKKWHRGIPEEGIKKKEKSVGLKPGHESENSESLFPSLASHLSISPPTLGFESPRTNGVHALWTREERMLICLSSHYCSI